jgi:hypothetical protein
MQFDEEGQEKYKDDIFDQMRDLGYETHNSLLNLGSIAIFTALWFLKLPIIGILYLLSRKWKVFGKPYKRMAE